MTISSVGNEHSWFDFIDRMNELLDKNNITSQPVKKKVLRTIIDQIKVSYDGVNKTHGLEVNFRIPMVVQRQVSGSKPKTPHCTYSTVTDFSLPQDLNDEGTNSVREFLTIKVLLTSSNLWMSPYSARQTELFELIRTQHEEMGKNFKQISDWLNEHGYKTTRGHTFRQNHVWSMYTKKKKSNQRFGREFVPSFRSVTVEIMDTLPPK